MKNNNKGFTIFELVTVLFGVIGAAVMVGLLYVAIHFISKIW